MPTTDSAADTILKRCDEVMERHIPGYPSGEYCSVCLLGMPCDAYSSARDLREAVEKFNALAYAVETWSVGFVAEQERDERAMLDALAACRHVLTTIAERGEAL